MPQLEQEYQRIAQQYGVSAEAVQQLAHALIRGRLKTARFNHPELGGIGKWRRGDVLLGDVRDEDHKTLVWRLAEELMPLLKHVPLPASSEENEQTLVMPWWGDRLLGEPIITDRFESVQYGYFLESRRVIVLRGDDLIHYDADGLLVTGLVRRVSPSRGLELILQTVTGEVNVEALPIIG